MYQINTQELKNASRTLTFSTDNYTMEPKAIQSQINSCLYEGGTYLEGSYAKIKKNGKKAVRR